MDIYYALWAQMSSWSLELMAVIVTGIFFVLVWVFLRLIGFRILSFIFVIMNWILKLLFMFFSGMFKIRVSSETLNIWNSISEKAEKASEFLENSSKKVQKPNKKVRNGLVLACVLIILCIIVPGPLGKIVNESYVGKISFVRELYINLEKVPLEKSKAYDPLIKIPVNPPQKERVLKLSEKGRAGANIRSESNKNSRAVTVVSGDIRMTYIREENGWIYVQLEDGTEGWIRNYLVEDAG